MKEVLEILKKHKKTIILTALICFVVPLLLMKLLSAKYFMAVSVISVVFTVLTVIVSVPIIHVNRNVNEKERGVYRKFSVIISLIEVLVFIVVLFVVKQSCVALSFALGQAAVALSMIAAIFKGMVKNRQEKSAKRGLSPKYSIKNI